jgi:hypothetical protein
MTKLSKLAAGSNAKPTQSLVLRPELLLCPNVPKPMHGTAPRTVMGDKWWNATRKAAYEASQFCCAACGVPKLQAKFRKWLEAHEIYKIDYAKGLMTYVEAVALCHCCHNYIHDGRMKAMLDAGKLNHAKYAAIIIHGDRVLAAAGLKKLGRMDRDGEMKRMVLNGEVADWGDWRLVIGKKKYKGLFKNINEWIAYHEEKNASPQED